MEGPKKLNRRNFLKIAAVAGIDAALGVVEGTQIVAQSKKQEHHPHKHTKDPIGDLITEINKKDGL